MAPRRTHEDRRLCFLVLLCLSYGVTSLSNKENIKNLQREVNEIKKMKEFEKKNDAIMSKLMNAAASLVNKDQLKTLKNELQQTGKEADRQQVEKLERIEAAVKDFDELMKRLNSPQKQADATKADPLEKMTKTVEDFLKKNKHFLGLSEEEAEEMLKMLQKLWKLLL